MPRKAPGTEPGATDQAIIEIVDENLKQGFAQVPRPVLRAKGLSLKAKAVYVLLLDYAWQSGSCFPGHERLAEDLDVSQDSVQRALQELRLQKLIDWKRRGLNQTNVYYILRLSENSCWDGPPGNRRLRFPETANGGLRKPQGGGPKNTQQKDTQSRVNPKNSTDRERDIDKSNPGGVWGGGDEILSMQTAGRQRRSRLTPIDDLVADHRANAGTTGRHHPTQGPKTAPESASNRPAEAEHRSDATELLKGPQRALRAKSRRSRATVPDWAAALMAQWSAVDFHDEPHQQSNITQVANLFAASGLSAEAFRARMYQARSLTLRYAGSIRKRAEGSDWQKNRAPYFFRILREQLGMADGQPAAAPQIPRSSPAQGVYPRPPDDSAAYFAGPWGEAIKRLREEQEADGGS